MCVFCVCQVHSDYVHRCRVCHPGDVMMTSPPPTDDIITEEEEEEDELDGASLRLACKPQN